jgi:hypothetical protein
VARDAQAIQAEIERARDALADAVDELSIRVHPRNVLERTKKTALDYLNQPRVKYPLIGVGALVLLVVFRRFFR